MANKEIVKRKKPGAKPGSRNRAGEVTDDMILQFAEDFIDREHRLPKNKEICDGTGLSSSCVCKRLAKLPLLEDLKSSPVKIGWRSLIKKVYENEMNADRNDPRVLDFLLKAVNGGRGFPTEIEMINLNPVPLMIIDGKMAIDEDLKEIIENKPGTKINDE